MTSQWQISVWKHSGKRKEFREVEVKFIKSCRKLRKDGRGSFALGVWGEVGG